MTKPIRRIPPRGNVTKIDFSDIAGICPQKSTYADVLRLHGNGYEVELIAPYQGKKRIHPGKRILAYRSYSLEVVFHDVEGDLPPDAPVTVVGVRAGSCLRTADGLTPGMTMAEAEQIITRNYQILHRIDSFIEIIPADGNGDTMLGLYPEDGAVAFIGLYVRC